MKDWSRVEVDRIYVALADWREQFQEHKSKVSPLMNAFKHKAKYLVHINSWYGHSASVASPV